MPKVKINDSQGLIQESGSGLVIDSSISVASLPTSPVSAQTSAVTLTSPGVYTISSSGALTLVMPLASSVPGGNFVFRCASAHAHVLTGSQESNGTKVFAGMAGATPNTEGSALTLPAIAGSSVALISDGNKFLVMAASGSCILSGT